MKNIKLKWRLSKLPSVEELRDLVKDKIITQDETREILFSLENDEDRDKKSLQLEIEFLRRIVQEMARNKTQIVEVIKEIKVPYYEQNWYKPYQVWCQSNSIYDTSATTLLNATVDLTGNQCSSDPMGFVDIKTFGQ